MGIEFNSGSLYIERIDKTSVLLGDDVLWTMEPEMIAEEVNPILYKPSQSASFSYEITNADLNLLENMYRPLAHSDKFTLQYYINVMVQKRWHKKARVNKKWLKRYGMKPDTVKVLADATMLDVAALDYDPINSSFEFESGNHRYILRSDQQRRGLKIVW